ncbi:PREDICTED: cell cycle checkpoint protein RAD1, partial [Ceratosolen solmsi marchali]|uniref:Cell cycle checkpoint protein RAD1 n=1 Tax=Ceratosolen solmsi marchali TaxID=326594 RepID=A0AAJ7DW09_9HYME
MSIINDGEYKLTAKLGNVKIVLQLLKAVNFKEYATFCVSANGMKITVEEAKCMQASAYIPVQLFEEFILTEDVIFRICLDSLIETLSMLGYRLYTPDNPILLHILYKRVGYPVGILIERNGIVVDCSLKSYDPDEILDFDLDPEAVVNKVLLQSELLKDIFAELDNSSIYLELLLSPKSPYFMISTKGTIGECHIELPHNTELIETFQCKKESKSKYLLKHMGRAMKAVPFSNKVSLRTNEAGILCFQYMIKTDNDVNCFIEYYVSPVINDDDDDD